MFMDDICKGNSIVRMLRKSDRHPDVNEEGFCIKIQFVGPSLYQIQATTGDVRWAKIGLEI
jgi:hypothetical protein